MKICNSCKTPKPLVDFGNNANKADGKQLYCKVCSKAKDKKHYFSSDVRRRKIVDRNKAARERNVLFLLSFLETHPCVDCGETNPILLDFDHLHKKRRDISSMVYYSLASIREEMDKCEVRCVKCHRIKTAKQFGYFKYLATIG